MSGITLDSRHFRIIHRLLLTPNGRPLTLDPSEFDILKTLLHQFDMCLTDVMDIPLASIPEESAVPEVIDRLREFNVRETQYGAYTRLRASDVEPDSPRNDPDWLPVDILDTWLVDIDNDLLNDTYLNYAIEEPLLARGGVKLRKTVCARECRCTVSVHSYIDGSFWKRRCTSPCYDNPPSNPDLDLPDDFFECND